MKKLPILLLLTVPYAVRVVCYQANWDFSIGLCIYGAVLAFNLV